MANEALDIAEKLSLFSEHWSPKVVARLNDHEIKVVKLKGEFVWHTHEDTDELFLVVDVSGAPLIEPVGVVNTGDAGGSLTAAYDDSLT